MAGKTYEIELEFLEPVLGTVPKDADIYARYIASLAPNGEDTTDEISSVQDEKESGGWTGFHMAGDTPIIYDYAIKGFFKDACSMLRRVTGTKSSKITAYKKVIDGLLFVHPRQIPIQCSEITILERPLRAQTPKGERVALARSDCCPAGSKMRFTIQIIGGLKWTAVKEWLDYGHLRGLGQWRNGGYGKFKYRLCK